MACVEERLAALGLPLDAPLFSGVDRHPDLEWALSGAMDLTGSEVGAPRLAPAPLASRARHLADALGALGRGRGSSGLDGAALLGEHAACLGLRRGGRVSPGGSCRLLPAEDGWLALNLARPDDRGLLPAWLGSGDGADAWRIAEEGLRGWRVDDAVERARLLGLAAAPAVAPPGTPPPWLRVESLGSPEAAAAGRRPLVVDLTALWAGPLCGELLCRAGARVVKVESTRRPDGLRSGNARLFDLLNAGKESVVLDFATQAGRAALRALVEHADVVLEGSRPRALRQLGLDAERWLAGVPGRVWTSITGYGRREPAAHWVAFGDDAAVAAGLAVATGSAREPLFCGDAVADPLAGLHAAVATLAALECGGGVLLEVALRDGVAHLLSGARGPREARVERCGNGYQVVLGAERAPVRAPRAREPRGRARPLGADNGALPSC